MQEFVSVGDAVQQLKVYRVKSSSPFTKTSAVKVTNSNGWLKRRLKAMMSDAEKLYAKREFMEKYTREGMDEMEMAEALHNVRDLISDFERKQPQSDDDESEEDEEEDDEEEHEEEDMYGHTADELTAMFER